MGVGVDKLLRDMQRLMLFATRLQTSDYAAAAWNADGATALA
jgi:hypothetical protein